MVFLCGDLRGNLHGASFRIRCPPVGPVLVTLPPTYPGSGRFCKHVCKQVCKQVCNLKMSSHGVSMVFAVVCCVAMVALTLPSLCLSASSGAWAAFLSTSGGASTADTAMPQLSDVECSLRKNMSLRFIKSLYKLYKYH